MRAPTASLCRHGRTFTRKAAAYPSVAEAHVHAAPGPDSSSRGPTRRTFASAYGHAPFSSTYASSLQRREHSATAQAMFLSAMAVRERILAFGARSQPDESAKVETLQMKRLGKVHPAVSAFRNNKLGFGFSAGGLLFPYFIGVMTALKDLNVAEQGKTPLAGASAGSLIAACFNSGLAPGEIMEACHELAVDLRNSGTYRRMSPSLEKVLQKRLPDDAHERCSGTTFIAITEVFPMRGRLISEFESKDDLIQCLLTSCHIPIYFAGSLARTFRGKLAYDGGVANFIPTPPDLDYATRVCCFPSQNINFALNIHIAPDCFDSTWDSMSLRQLLNWALLPADKDVLDKIYEKGRFDAAAWAELTGVQEAATWDEDDWYRQQQMEKLPDRPPKIEAPPPVSDERLNAAAGGIQWPWRPARAVTNKLTK